MTTQTQYLNSPTIKEKTRNGLIEFYRFLFALWVVYYHGFFIFKNEYFSHGYIAVEFFFILSGFYLIKSIDKYKEQNLIKGLSTFCWTRLKSLGLPFIIGSIFAIWFMFIEGEVSLLGYLWYIPTMFIVFITIFILRKYIKNEKIFILLLCLFVSISYIILYVPILQGFGIFRALGGISIGILFSYIKKIDLKYKNINFNLIITLLIFFIILLLAYLPKPNFISEYFLIFLLMPLLIYFTNTLNINCSFLNFLGSLSFGLYAYQCVLRVIEAYFPLEQYLLFIILISIVLIEKLVMYAIKKYKNKQKTGTF